MLVVYIPLGIFLGTIGVIIILVLILGSLAAAKDDMKKRYEKKQNKKTAALAKYEFEGFEQALAVTAREMKML